jgi:hypothetical protein
MCQVYMMMIYGATAISRWKKLRAGSRTVFFRDGTLYHHQKATSFFSNRRWHGRWWIGRGSSSHAPAVAIPSAAHCAARASLLLSRRDNKAGRSFLCTVVGGHNWPQSTFIKRENVSNNSSRPPSRARHRPTLLTIATCVWTLPTPLLARRSVDALRRMILPIKAAVGCAPRWTSSIHNPVKYVLMARAVPPVLPARVVSRTDARRVYTRLYNF